jgi:hypothetical protein
MTAVGHNQSQARSETLAEYGETAKQRTHGRHCGIHDRTVNAVAAELLNLIAPVRHDTLREVRLILHELCTVGDPVSLVSFCSRSSQGRTHDADALEDLLQQPHALVDDDHL